MIKEISIQVENLKCGGCANTIKKGLLSLDGIENVTINIEDSKVVMEINNTFNTELAIEKLSKMGYPQIGDPNSILKKAKSFVTCAIGRIDKEE